MSGTSEWPEEVRRALENMPTLIRLPPGTPTIRDLINRAAVCHRTEPFVAVWLHCSPALLEAGYHCPSGPRRTCECHPAGVWSGHDHFVDRWWAGEFDLLERTDT